MAQRQKEHVRAEIVAAAASLFAETGYEATTMAAVAERSGFSIGNVYKYFSGKEELFAAVIPDTFVSSLERSTKARIKALGDARDVTQLAEDSPYHAVSAELLDVCIAHRDQVVILLGREPRRARGTPYEPFADNFSKKLVDWALEYARAAYPSVRVSASLRFALGNIYPSYLAALANALAAFDKPDAIREAVALISSYHLSGLKALFEKAAADSVR